MNKLLALVLVPFLFASCARPPKAKPVAEPPQPLTKNAAEEVRKIRPGLNKANAQTGEAKTRNDVIADAAAKAHAEARTAREEAERYAREGRATQEELFRNAWQLKSIETRNMFLETETRKQGETIGLLQTALAETGEAYDKANAAAAQGDMAQANFQVQLKDRDGKLITAGLENDKVKEELIRTDESRDRWRNIALGLSAIVLIGLALIVVKLTR